MKRALPENLMISLIIVVFFICNIPQNSFGQLKVPERTELYRDNVVSRIDISIDQEDLDFILTPENRGSDELFAANFIFSNDMVNDTLENVGFRLRGNTSRGADKKSFKIDINALVPGRRFYGVQKINLNGQHNDPTSARAKICADLADRIGIPSLRTNHVELYINGEYFGLYTNTEHVDQNYAKKRFGNKNGNLYKCLYPADLNYKGDNPNSYKEVIYGRRNYDLKSNEHADDYSDFANFVKVLNLTSDNDFSCELEKVFNVDLYLRAIIFDILTGNWDGPIYNQNNFYLYHNQNSGQFEYIPYDLDNTLGINWTSKDWGIRDIYNWSQEDQARPLYNRIMGNQEYRDRYSFYMREVLYEIFNEAELYPYLDDMKNRLKEFIADDIYYTLDYGFDVDDFEDGFEIQIGYVQTDYGIKEYIQTRLIAAFNQLELNDMLPAITDVQNNYPNENEEFVVRTKIVDDQGIDNVFFNHDFESVAMFDDGEHFDREANDGIYGVSVPSDLVANNSYTITAIDINGQESTYPRCSEITVNVEEVDLKLAINEFMASNNTTIKDELDEYDDWIELYNHGNSPIFLGDKYLSDNPDNDDKWSMPHYTIEPDEYLLLWADDDRNQGTFHTNFKLLKAGEYIGIFDNDGSIIDEVEYNSQESDVSRGRIPNGTGNFISMTPTPDAPNIGTSSIGEALEPDIKISPNPTSHIVSIESEEEIVSIRLFDPMGREIEVQSAENGAIELPKLSGVYFIQFSTKSQSRIISKVLKL